MSTTQSTTRDTTETPEEALARIRSGFSKNDMAVIQTFAMLGIPPEDIDPRGNVLTFKAWKAAGRKVAKGATSISVPVYIPAKGRGEIETTKADGTAEKTSAFVIKRHARLFHESQTLPADAPKGTRPAAMFNPHLIKIEKDDVRSYYDVTADELAAETERLNEQRKQQQAEQDERTATAIEEQGGTFEVEQVTTEEDAPEAPETPAEPSTPEPAGLIAHTPKQPADDDTAGYDEATEDDTHATAEPELIDDAPPAEAIAVSACTCPMAGFVTNVNCPIHGPEAREREEEMHRKCREAREREEAEPKQRQLALI